MVLAALAGAGAAVLTDRLGDTAASADASPTALASGSSVPDPSASADAAPLLDPAAASPTPARVAAPTPTPTPTRAFPATDDELAQIDDPASTLVVVNKQRPLQPADYAPEVVSVGHGHGMRADAAAALTDLLAAADADGVAMFANSAYRSYGEQATTYDGWRRKLGQNRADELSARAGYSEHQTGLAADMRPLTGTCRAYSSCFPDTPQAAWLAEHAWEYGYIVRYPPDQEAVTGYAPEPWHIRFVGVEFARTFHDSGAATLEAYFGLPPAPTY